MSFRLDPPDSFSAETSENQDYITANKIAVNQITANQIKTNQITENLIE